MRLFQNILCAFLGHKADKHNHILAYSIESHLMSYEVKIYDIAKCSRCGNIYKKALLTAIVVMIGIQKSLLDKKKKGFENILFL